jgi:hypothetical protein
LGEDGFSNNDLHEYRQRIQVLNEDIQSCISDEEEGIDDEGNENKINHSNKVHNL